jgi:hypothetical protein
MAIGIVGLNLSGVKKKQTCQFVNLNICDAAITRCRALTNLPLTIGGALDSELATVEDVEPGEYEYSYEHRQTHSG